jgi:hypothetical protein
MSNGQWGRPRHVPSGRWMINGRGLTGYQSKVPGFELFFAGTGKQHRARWQRLQHVRLCNRRELNDTRENLVKEICLPATKFAHMQRLPQVVISA